MLMLPCRPPRNSVPKAVKDMSLGHIHKMKLEKTEVPTKESSYLLLSQSGAKKNHFTRIYPIHLWCTFWWKVKQSLVHNFSTKYRNMFHLVLFCFRLQNILFDVPVVQQQADIPEISDAAISGLENDVSRGWPSLWCWRVSENCSDGAPGHCYASWHDTHGWNAVRVSGCQRFSTWAERRRALQQLLPWLSDIGSDWAYGASVVSIKD